MRAMRTAIHVFVLSAAVLLLVGCASTRQFVPMPDQSKRIEDPSKGRIYLMRPATIGFAVSMNVTDEGKIIGCTGPRGYLCWERPPGETRITSATESVSTVPLTVQAGGAYYIFQHLRMGLMIAGNQLEFVDEEEGQRVLKRCKPAKVN